MCSVLRVNFSVPIFPETGIPLASVDGVPELDAAPSASIAPPPLLEPDAIAASPSIGVLPEPPPGVGWLEVPEEPPELGPPAIPLEGGSVAVPQPIENNN